MLKALQQLLCHAELVKLVKPICFYSLIIHYKTLLLPSNYIGVFMVRLRPARTMRDASAQAWARYSLKNPKKNYVKALPHTSLLIFKMGVEKPYDVELRLESQQKVQLRSNALEAARLLVNKQLESQMPQNYLFRVLVYPHNVIREHKMATGAGADRISQGMSLSFGRPISVAARVNRNQAIFSLRVNAQNRKTAAIALKKAALKLSGAYKVRAYEIKNN
jgi:large subunit ribosomal protein L10e